MCLAVPSKIVQMEDGLGIVEVDGVRREVSLMLLEEPRLGDYVIVHAGFALHKLDEEAAMETLALLREALAMTEDGGQKTVDRRR